MSARAWRRGMAGLLAVATTANASACSGPPQQPPPAAAPSGSAGSLPVALDGSLRALEEGDRDAPRDTWDTGYVVRQVGRDPQQLLTWVREQTYWIPYRGSLRGPVGVLMDRQGNGLDRALLLAALLQQAGQTVRLARGALSREQATQCLPALLAARRSASIPPARASHGAGEEARAVAAGYPLDADAVARSVDAQVDAMTRVLDDLAARVDDQGRRLAAVLPRPDRDEEWTRRFEAAVDSLRDHWWVERLDGAVWLGLDPLPADGQPLTERRETFDPAALPTELRHEIAVRVVAEERSDEALARRTVLEHTLRPAERIGSPIVLQFWPVDWPADFEASGPDAAQALRAMALKQRRWSAALFVGRELAAQGQLREDGVAAAPRASGGALGALGGGLSRSLGGDTPSGRGALTAVWLEFEIRVPGEAPRTLRRVVFDLLGPAARRARTPIVLDPERRLARSLALTMRTEMVPLACDLSPEFVAHLMAQGLLANRELLRAAAGEPLDRGSARFAELLEGSVPTLSPLHSLALARFGWSDFAASVFVDRPGLLTRHVFLATAGGRIVRRDATDIVANEVGVDLLEPDAFAVRLRQGVLDTNAEALLHGEGPVRANTGEAYARGRDWPVLTSADDRRLAAPDVSDDVRQRVRADLEAGYAVVIAPGAAAGWWRVDRKEGHALGVDANGWGAATAERSILAEFATNAFAEFLFCSAMHEFVAEVRDGGQSVAEAVAQGRPWRPSISGGSVTVCAIQGAMVGAMATLPLIILRLHWRFLRFGPWRGPSFLPRLGGPKGPRVVARPPGGSGPVDPNAPTESGRRVIRPGGGNVDPHADTGNRPIRPRGADPGDPHADTEGRRVIRGGDPAHPEHSTEADPSRTQHDRRPREAPHPDEGPPRPPTAEELRRLAAEADGADQASFEATQRYVQYRANKPAPGRGHAGDPANWDPVVDDALHQDMLRKQQDAIDANRRWEIMKDLYERAGVPPWQPPPQTPPGGGSSTGPAQQVVVGGTGAAQVVRRP